MQRIDAAVYLKEPQKTLFFVGEEYYRCALHFFLVLCMYLMGRKKESFTKTKTSDLTILAC